MNPQTGKISTSHVTLQATQSDVRQGLEHLKETEVMCALTVDEMATVELVLAEILNNIVEHAYKGADRGKIEVGLTQTNRGLRCVVLDDGLPMPNGEPPLGMQADLSREISELPEGGFGWFLIRELAHDLSYANRSGRNHLTFRLSVGQRA